MLERVLGRAKDPRIEADPRRLPPGQTLTQKWPVLSYGPTPHYDMAAWRFRLFGEVEQERSLGFEELLALPATDVVADMHCVTAWSRLDNHWKGVAFRELARLASVRPEAPFVIAHSYQGYTTNLPLEVAMDDDVLVAYQHDGAPLHPEHGGPLRLVVPKKYAWKSAKWLEGLEFVQHDRLGFWEVNGYNSGADPWKEERYW